MSSQKRLGKPTSIDVKNLKGNGGSASSPPTPLTPKTPAEEGLDFFSGAVQPGEGPIRVYELRLSPDGGPSKDLQYVRLPPAYTPYILRVSIEAGTPASKNGVFKTNFPLDGKTFGRERYAERTLPQDFSKPIQIDLPIAQAGAYKYWVEYEGSSGVRIKGHTGYFNIDPVLKLKARSPILDSSLAVLSPGKGAVVQDDYVNLPLDGLSVLTVVSKWMGPIDEWKPHFAEAKERGYTMLHYPPLQERGESDSPYSIRDQNRYDPALFAPGQLGTDSTGRHKVEEILKIAKEEYGLLSLTDVVLNHTANDSAWLVEHPEAGFSPANTPHLTPALELDSAILDFSASLASKDLPTAIESNDDLTIIMDDFEKTVRSLHLWQYYVIDVAREKDSVKASLNSGKVKPWTGPNIANKNVVDIAKIIRQEEGLIHGLAKYASRFGVKFEPDVAAGIAKAAFTLVEDHDVLAEAWGKVIDVLNVPLYEEWEADTKAALDLVRGRVKYTRLDEHGPKMGEISKEKPLVEPYFTRLAPTPDADPLVYSLANNGWIWDADPLQNFALLPSKAYLRREVIVWGDCVKLRYGKQPSDNPWLWQYMTSYVEALAHTFDGFRIDNCHSTPLEVGTHMLDAARVIRPDLYICAELFTGNEDTDLVFVQELGINSLIRESFNGWDPKEYSRLLYRHGLGKPIGSMDGACMVSKEEITSPTGKGPVRQAVVIPVNGSLPHALLYDLTHDNESPLDKRSAEDALSTGALVAFSFCATGSVKGFDDLYPKLLNLVHEKRRYELSGQEDTSGIAKVKRVLSALHLEMVHGGFEEGHVHQENDYIMLHRVQPQSLKGYLVVAHTAFHKGSKDRGHITPIQLRRTRAKYVLGASIEISSYDVPKDPEIIRGLPSKLVDIPPANIARKQDDAGPYSEIVVPDYFPPGSIMVFETQIEDFDADLEGFCKTGAYDAVKDLDLVDLNVVLHRADVEERDATAGVYGTYDIPGSGKLVYCGLEGWMHPLRHIMQYNDLGHSLCGHLREGTWAFDYIHQRLSSQTDTLPNLAKPAQWLKERCDRVKSSVPNFMRPKYFALIISEAYKAARQAVIEQCSEFVVSGHSFIQDLALCAVQMYGLVKSASLDPGVVTPSLAAGLPHFTKEWARCWGRDVFISLSGLFLTTGNFEGAKKHILAFSTTLKHGLIPNLLDSVRSPRYNSRDSPWWMLQNIQDYVKTAPDGLSLLSETIKRRFPKDDTWVPWNDPRAYSETSTIAEIIQEILQRHAEGIDFREYNAGPNLDMQMKSEGFNISIRTDWETGFTLGGSEYNCGTWMDKMGESEKAGTKGKPGTPRDGAPVEIIGLLKSTLRWLSELVEKNKFPFNGVKAKIRGEERLVTYKEWSDLIQANFEKHFYVPLDPADDSKYKVDTRLINRRGTYKDTYGAGAGREWSDYQFRCNFPIAMTVAPELFDPKHALHALKLADKVLRGPLGMKTLDPSDMQYRPNYDNSNDGTDAAIAKGLNYHQGPEWGWPLGYFLRAYLQFALLNGEDKKNDLEEERRKFLEGELKEGDDDLPVLTWGEESYDGLGDTLQEGGDELNDETFGGVGQVGKDFDFTRQTLPDFEKPQRDPGKEQAPAPRQHHIPQSQSPLHQQQPFTHPPAASTRTAGQSLESIWDDKSPFAVLGKLNGSSSARPQDQQQPHHLPHHTPRQPTGAPTPPIGAKFSPFLSQESPVLHQQHVLAHGAQQARPRTLQEIEEEMLMAAVLQAKRREEEERALQMERLLLQQQELQRQEEEQRRYLELRQQKEHQDRLYEQQQYQRLAAQFQQQQQQQQQQQYQQQRTPPPRMLPSSQSPRFLEHQRHQTAVLLQQERQQQLLLQERERQQQQLQERRQRQIQELLEQQEMERRMAQAALEDKRLWQQQEGHAYLHEHQQRGFNSPSPARHLQQQLQLGRLPPGSNSHEISPQTIQMQQRLLNEMAQSEFARDVQGMQIPGGQGISQEQLRAEAMKRIVEHERMEEKRRRKAQKIAHMSRYNDLMTQSDKDFITRIQVSQLVTQDPYADDFYAQVYGAILRSRMGLQAQDERVIKFGSGGGIGLGLAQRGPNRRPSAMQRMEQQVERIVNNARKREEEKGLHSLQNLQGALGKTSGRSYKAAPRQLLQVDSSSPTLAPAHAHISKASVYNEGAAKEAAKLGREALGDAHQTGETIMKEPLTQRETLINLEHLYDLVLQVEQLRRDQPHPEDEEEVFQAWQMEYDETANVIWDEMKVMVPLETSNPHPFISLLMPTKGKRILPRLTRHLSSERMLTLLTLLVACFDQLDVIKQAPILDSLVETPERAEVERQTQAFLGSVMQSILPVVSVAELRLVTGLLSLLLHRSNIVAVAQTRPGLALLTLFLSRVEVIKQTIASGNDSAVVPTPEETEAWQLMFDHLFQLLAPHLLLLFPSTRIAHTNITGQPPAVPSSIDIVDQPVWQFLAALALHAVTEQHQILVTSLREKVLDNVFSVNKGWVVDEEERQTKLANVNLFLHALGLDSSQIAM
ncbi:hypothetical protein H1R20_g9280, partial [Candolleomyces eurysporus]